MNVKKATGLLAAACGLVALASVEASAQYTPTLGVSVAGNIVTISWTPIAGAQGYTLEAGSVPGAANIAVVSLPVSFNQVVIAAPPGTYYVRVRAFAGALVGPNSNEGVVTVGGPPPCPTPTPPVVTTGVVGGNVTVNWGAVAGAIGYQIEFSRFPGATELVQQVGPGQTSFAQYVPLIGTFYVRVTTANACGVFATSSEHTFTIQTLVGPGPRTPDPPPGQLLPVPGYVRSVVEQVASQFPGDLHNSCREHGGTNTFMFRVVHRLRQIDTRWALNYKRGQPGDLSQDIAAYNPTNRPDVNPATGRGEDQIYLFDIIFGHCGSNPGPNWQNVTHETWAGAGHPACGTHYCAEWTLSPYIAAGFPADQR